MKCELVKKQFKTKEGKVFWKLYLEFDDGRIQIEGHKGEFEDKLKEEKVKFNTATKLIAKATTLKDNE